MEEGFWRVPAKGSPLCNPRVGREGAASRGNEEDHRIVSRMMDSVPRSKGDRKLPQSDASSRVPQVRTSVSSSRFSGTTRLLEAPGTVSRGAQHRRKRKTSRGDDRAALTTPPNRGGEWWGREIITLRVLAHVSRSVFISRGRSRELEAEIWKTCQPRLIDDRCLGGGGGGDEEGLA